MSDLTPDPKDFEEDHFPLRGGDWIINSNDEVAQVKAVHCDNNSWLEKPEFIVDIIYHDHNGRRIGRKSENVSFEIAGKRYRGPRSFEPAVNLEGWSRIKKPDFPIERRLVWIPHPTEPGKQYGEYRVDVTPRVWGNYARRKRVIPVAPQTNKPNFDPELERRARKLAAELLRDKARETGDESLRDIAIQLEKEAENF